MHRRTTTLLVLAGLTLPLTTPAAALGNATLAASAVSTTALAAARTATRPAAVHEVPLAASGARELDTPFSARGATRPLAAGTVRGATPFSAVGVTWREGTAPADVAVQVRARGVTGRWGAWHELEVQANGTGDPGSADTRGTREGSDPLYVGPSTAVQVRVDGAASPRDLRVALVDPGVSGVDAAAARPVGAALARSATAKATPTSTTDSTTTTTVPRPSYVTRAGWGADESLKNCTPDVGTTIKGAILHTTATGNDYSASESASVMRSMYAYHTNSLGWCDLGYNFVVDRFGTIFEGRAGSVDKPIVGAHTGGFNTDTVGVSMMGNHDEVTPSSAMLKSVEKVFAWKLSAYKRDALGKVTYVSGGGSSTKIPEGTKVTANVISGHRDYSTKSCPGDKAYPLLPSIRTAVAKLMKAPVTPKLTLSVSPSTIKLGQQTTISGTLTAGGDPLAKRTVLLYVRHTGSSTWGKLSTRTTDSKGHFEGTHSPTSSLVYQARYAGESGYAPVTKDASLTVKPK